MSIALLIGCGNTRGEKIVKGCQQAGLSVVNIGKSQSQIPDVEHISIEWADLDIITLHKKLGQIKSKISFIFFNQNSSTLAQHNFEAKQKTLDIWGVYKSWTKSYWLSCQMPFVIVHTLSSLLTNDVKIGWMLSNFIDRQADGVETHPDYSGYKYTNYLIMKNFNKNYKCFGINPEFKTKDKIENLVYEICTNKKSCDGKMF
tara:strand:+ start:5303 stop:5908 length:606 start_codon:yes stop_codon:yes gene_type:complete